MKAEVSLSDIVIAHQLLIEQRESLSYPDDRFMDDEQYSELYTSYIEKLNEINEKISLLKKRQDEVLDSLIESLK